MSHVRALFLELFLCLYINKLNRIQRMYSRYIYFSFMQGKIFNNPMSAIICLSQRKVES